MKPQGEVPIFVELPGVSLTFYPTPDEFKEISKVMKEQGKTRDEAVLIVMSIDYKVPKNE